MSLIFKNIKAIGSTQDLLIIDSNENYCGHKPKVRFILPVLFSYVREKKKSKTLAEAVNKNIYMSVF